MDKRNVDESFRLMYNTPWTKEMLMNRLVLCITQYGQKKC